MICLNYRDGRPIYEQVRDNLRELVVSGAIEEGEKLPSVRAMAASLAINPNTIQRAYGALELEGYLVTEPGKGVYAARGGAGSDPRKQNLLSQFDIIAAELVFLGVGVPELAQRLELAAEKRGGAR